MPLSVVDDSHDTDSLLHIMTHAVGKIHAVDDTPPVEFEAALVLLKLCLQHESFFIGRIWHSDDTSLPRSFAEV